MHRKNASETAKPSKDYRIKLIVYGHASAKEPSVADASLIHERQLEASWLRPDTVPIAATIADVCVDARITPKPQHYQQQGDDATRSREGDSQLAESHAPNDTTIG
jgi:hypothetical protein